MLFLLVGLGDVTKRFPSRRRFLGTTRTPGPAGLDNIYGRFLAIHLPHIIPGLLLGHLLLDLGSTHIHDLMGVQGFTPFLQKTVSVVSLFVVRNVLCSLRLFLSPHIIHKLPNRLRDLAGKKIVLCACFSCLVSPVCGC